MCGAPVPAEGGVAAPPAAEGRDVAGLALRQSQDAPVLPAPELARRRPVGGRVGADRVLCLTYRLRAEVDEAIRAEGVEVLPVGLTECEAGAGLGLPALLDHG